MTADTPPAYTSRAEFSSRTAPFALFALTHGDVGASARLPVRGGALSAAQRDSAVSDYQPCAEEATGTPRLALEIARRTPGGQDNLKGPQQGGVVPDSGFQSEDLSSPGH